MSRGIDCSAVLDRAKDFLGERTDISLAVRLGVARTTPATWRYRGNFDFRLVLSACRGVDLDWLLWGEPREPEHPPPPIGPRFHRKIEAWAKRREAGESFEDISESVGLDPEDLEEAALSYWRWEIERLNLLIDNIFPLTPEVELTRDGSLRGVDLDDWDARAREMSLRLLERRDLCARMIWIHTELGS